jgi:hypothetical protein
MARRIRSLTIEVIFLCLFLLFSVKNSNANGQNIPQPVTSLSSSGSTHPVLTWNASLSSPLTCYRIYRNSAQIATVSPSVTTYTDEEIGLNSGGTQYSYTVKADSSGYLSVACDPVTVTGNLLSKNSFASVNIPKLHKLLGNYPNPFNPETNIVFDLAEENKVTLKIYNIQGQEVAVLLNSELKPAGRHSVKFFSGKFPGGIYFYKIYAGKFKQTRKMSLVK